MSKFGLSFTTQPERLCPECGIVIPSNANHFCAAPVAVPAQEYGYCKVHDARHGECQFAPVLKTETPAPAPLPPPQEPCPCPCHKLKHASLEVQEGCLSCSGTGLKAAVLAGETRQEAQFSSLKKLAEDVIEARNALSLAETEDATDEDAYDLAVEKANDALDYAQLRFEDGCDADTILSLISQLAAAASRIAQLEQERQEIMKALCITLVDGEYEGSEIEYEVPAEPEPVYVPTLKEAIQKTIQLCENDCKKAEKISDGLEAALREVQADRDYLADAKTTLIAQTATAEAALTQAQQERDALKSDLETVLRLYRWCPALEGHPEREQYEADLNAAFLIGQKMSE